MYCCGGDHRPPRGRSGMVYFLIGLIGALIGIINEPIAVIFTIIAWHLAWVSS